MYRAIPEVSRICSMQDRSRKYKIHLDTLNKIKKSANRTLYALPGLRGDLQFKPRVMRGRAQREKHERINQENKKMVNAIVYRQASINRADLKEHERDHEHQVARMTKRNHPYGFDGASKKQKYHSSFNEKLEPMEPTKESEEQFQNEGPREDEGDFASEGEVNNEVEPVDNPEVREVEEEAVNNAEDEGYAANNAEDEGYAANNAENEGYAANNAEDEGYAANNAEDEGYAANNAEDEGDAVNNAEDEGYAANNAEDEGYAANNVEDEGYAANNAEDGGDAVNNDE